MYWTLLAACGCPRKTLTFMCGVTGLRSLCLTTYVLHRFRSCPQFKSDVGVAGVYADGGSNTEGPPKIGDQFCGILAVRTGLIMAHLHEIPNQPAYFTAEKPVPKRRIEDAVIAYGWSHFINDTSNPEWLPRLPMVKSVIKTMYRNCTLLF